MFHRLLLLLCAAVSLLHTEILEPLVLSDADQIAALKTHSNLIDGIVSPLSGQACLSYKDLEVKGAQSLALNRFYIAPHMPTAFSSHRYDMSVLGDQLQRQCLYAYLDAHYQGWQILPHLYLVVTKQSPLTIRLVEPCGITLDLEILSDGSVHPTGETYGLTNICEDIPSGANDIRNTRIQTDSVQETITVIASDGVVRIYQKGATYYLLRKEILLNGSVIRYSYNDDILCKIESLDPQERFAYACIDVNGSPEKGCWEFSTNSGLTASYRYVTRS